MSIRAVRSIEYVRNRIQDLVNGDRNVDMGSLLIMLTDAIPELGGETKELTMAETRPRYFVEKD